MERKQKTKKAEQTGAARQRAVLRKRVDRALAEIAERTLQIGTLEERKSDSLDFHDVAVWGIREALEAAYRLGKEA